MNSLVKLIINEDGGECDPLWHLISETGGSDSLLCSGEVYGYGEGNARGITKNTKRGGITCRECLSIVREIKKVRL